MRPPSNSWTRAPPTGVVLLIERTAEPAGLIGRAAQREPLGQDGATDHPRRRSAVRADGAQFVHCDLAQTIDEAETEGPERGSASVRGEPVTNRGRQIVERARAGALEPARVLHSCGDRDRTQWGRTEDRKRELTGGSGPGQVDVRGEGWGGGFGWAPRLHGQSDGREQAVAGDGTRDVESRSRRVPCHWRARGSEPPGGVVGTGAGGSPSNSRSSMA